MSHADMVSRWFGATKPTALFIPTGRPVCPFMITIKDSIALVAKQEGTLLIWWGGCSIFPVRRPFGCSTTTTVWDWIWIRRHPLKRCGVPFQSASRSSGSGSCFSAGKAAARRSSAPISAPCGNGSRGMRRIIQASRCIPGLLRPCNVWTILTICWMQCLSMAQKKKNQPL